MAGGVAQGVGPQFKPQYRKKQSKTKTWLINLSTTANRQKINEFGSPKYIRSSDYTV
jgi:hypothetical protein